MTDAARSSNPSVEGKLWVPSIFWVNMMPPAPPPPKVAVSVFLTNNSRHDVTLSVPTPCDERSWEVTDEAAGMIIQRYQRPQICPDHVVEVTIAAGATVRFDDTITFTPGVLKTEQWYRLDYQYMGVPCSNSFFARFAV